MMGALEITSLLVTISVAGMAIIRILRDSLKNLGAIVTNILFGGILYVVLNVMGFSITINVITTGIIVLLGIPGIALIIFLKIMFGIF